MLTLRVEFNDIGGLGSANVEMNGILLGLKHLITKNAIVKEQEFIDGCRPVYYKKNRNFPDLNNLCSHSKIPRFLSLQDELEFTIKSLSAPTFSYKAM